MKACTNTWATVLRTSVFMLGSTPPSVIRPVRGAASAENTRACCHGKTRTRKYKHRDGDHRSVLRQHGYLRRRGALCVSDAAGAYE